MDKYSTTANTFRVFFDSVVEVGTHEGEGYEGSYEVIPKTISQTLPTAHKYLYEDVLVHEIPYAETTNDYGTTATIAS